VVRVPGYRFRFPRFDSWCYHIFWEIVCLEWGSLSFVRITEELLECRVAAPVHKIQINGRWDPLRWLRDTPLPAKVGSNFADQLLLLNRYVLSSVFGHEEIGCYFLWRGRRRKQKGAGNGFRKGVKMSYSGIWYLVALVGTDASEERIASIIRVKEISELGTLAVTSDVLTLFLVRWLFWSWWLRRYVPAKRRFLQEPHGVTFQKMAFFIVTAVETSNYISTN
jgi:hypothetical protein